jgi:hypothetical protein
MAVVASRAKSSRFQHDRGLPFTGNRPADSFDLRYQIALSHPFNTDRESRWWRRRCERVMSQMKLSPYTSQRVAETVFAKPSLWMVIISACVASQ